MKSTASCQPEQSIEPYSQNYGGSSDLEERRTKFKFINKFWKTRKNNKKRKFFVPIHEATKKSIKEKRSLNRTLKSIQQPLKNDSTYELLSLLKEDSETQQQRDERYFTLTERMLTIPVTTTQLTPFTSDRASHYDMMEQQYFETPHHLHQPGRYRQNNQEISYDTNNSRTFENL